MNYPDLNSIKPEFRPEDQDLIDDFLQREDFQQHIQNDIGTVHNVQVDWDQNEIRFYGVRTAKTIPIDATLANLKNQIH